MNKNQVHRFLNKELSREELIELHEKVSFNESDIIQSIEEDWYSYENNDTWPAKHWNDLEKQLIKEISHKEKSRVFRLHWLVKVAASLLLLVSAWFAIQSSFNNKPDSSGSPAMITHTNDSNQPENVVLKDGTQVLLAANSTISYYENFNEKYRVVHLEGEAYFETNKENIRPFIVISDNITSICRGHEFSVSAFQDSEEINVVSSSGQIEIAQNDRLNSEYNKVAVESCQRYSFNKSKQQYFIGRVSDCEFEEKVKVMKTNSTSKAIVML